MKYVFYTKGSGRIANFKTNHYHSYLLITEEDRHSKMIQSINDNASVNRHHIPIVNV